MNRQRSASLDSVLGYMVYPDVRVEVAVVGASREPEMIGEKHMAKLVEVFWAGCPLCEETLQRVRPLVSNEDELIVQDLRTEGGRRRAAALGVARVPALAVNGSLAECCHVEPVRVELLGG